MEYILKGITYQSFNAAKFLNGPLRLLLNAKTSFYVLMEICLQLSKQTADYLYL